MREATCGSVASNLPDYREELRTDTINRRELAGARLAVDVYDRLVPVNFTVADLQVEVAIRACADPCFVVHCGTLPTKI